MSFSYIIFQILNLHKGDHALVDKFIGALILTVYNACFLLGMEFETDLTPAGNLNRLITGLGKKPRTF